MCEARAIGTVLALLLSLAVPVSSGADELPPEPGIDIESQPDPPPESNSDFAAALALDGKLEEALAVYAEVLERNPGQREATFGRARVLGWLGRYEESLAVLDATLADSPDDVGALVLRARVLGWSERYESGEADARHALSVAPHFVDAYIVLGDLLTWSQRGGEASDHELVPESALRVSQHGIVCGPEQVV